MNKKVLRVIYVFLFVATFAGYSSSHHLNVKAADANGGSIVNISDYSNGTPIDTCSDFFNKIENNPSGSFYISQDIDCSGLSALPIQNFYGTLHGFSHKVSNLSLANAMIRNNSGIIDNIEFDNFTSDLDNSRGVNIGGGSLSSEPTIDAAFVVSNWGSISNLKFINTNVTANNPIAQNGINVGPIVGVNYGMINTTSVQGFLTVYTEPSTSGYIVIGGMIGANNGTVSNSYSDVSQSIHVSGWYITVGGLVGYDNGPIENDYAAGSISYVTANASNGTGGLYGRADAANNNLTVAHNSFSTTQINNSGGIANPGGILGQSNAGGDITETNYFDSVAAGTTNCGGSSVIPVTGCTPIDTNAQPGYFTNNSTNPPFTSWDFTNIWQTTSGLPELRPPQTPITDPTNLSASQTTSTGVHLSWSPATVPSGISVYYTVFYQITGSNDVWAIDTGSDATTKDLPALTLGNSYTFWVIAYSSNGYYSGSSNQISYTPSQVSISVSTCQQLQDMNNDLGATYTLTQDIDCSDSVNWNEGAGFLPIGGNLYNNEQSFTGTLNGNGFSISNLTQVSYYDVAGLFGSTNGAHIRNLTLNNETISGNYHIGGGIAGIAQNTTFTNVKVTNLNATVTPYQYDTTWTDLGGLVGDGYGITIEGSSVNGSLNAQDDYQDSKSSERTSISGLVSYLSNTNIYQSAIRNSFASVNITNGGFDSGLVGYGNNYSINDSYSTGTITTYSTTNSAGGLVEAITEYGANVTIANSFSTVKFVATNYDHIGGIIGTNLDNDSSSPLDISTNYTNTACSGLTTATSNSTCHTINDQTDPVTYFSSNNSNLPLSGWDFTTVWQLAADYPTLNTTSVSDATADINSTGSAYTGVNYQYGRRGLPNSPINLAVSGNNTSGVTLTWDTPIYDGGFPISHYQIYYKQSTDSDWTYYDYSYSNDYTFAPHSVLRRGVSYDFKVTAVQDYGEGPGATTSFTIPPPPTYSISTCQELQDMSNGEPDGTYNLTQDIDCTDSKNWNDGKGFLPLGNGSDFQGAGRFQGTFNGNGHKIINLYEDIESQVSRYWLENSLGLFAQIDQGIISNLTFDSPIITANDTSYTGMYLGALAGYVNNSSITNVHVTNGKITVNGEVVLDAYVYGAYVGGLVGEVDYSTMEQDSYQGNIDNVATTDNGNYNEVGGLVAYLYESSVSNSFANISITNASADVGGLFAYAEYGASVVNSYSTGVITVSPSLLSYVTVGGIDSYPYDVTYTNSFTNVKIIVPQNINPDTTSVYIGLFAGYDGGYNVDTSTSYYDANPGGTPDLPCAGYLDGNTPMSCNAVNVNNSAPKYFFNNTTNPPLNHWDFNQIWGVTSGLPILNPNRIVTPVTPPTSHNSAGQTHKNPIPYKPNSPPVKTPPTTKSTQKKSFITSATKNNVVAGFFKAIGNDLGSIVKKIPASVVVNFPYVLFAILLIGVFLAFSEWLRQSARLKRALRVVKKQQKLAEERDTFWHLAANYLRAPVTLLVGGAELLQDESFDPKITHRITTIASNLQLKVRSIMAKIERSTTLRAIEHPKETKTPSVFTNVRFWLPVLLVLGFGLLSNYIARDYRKINISTIHLWTELLLFVVIVVALYIVLDALGITSRRIDQTEQLIKEQEEELDTAREDLIGSTARELSGDVHRIETLVEEVPDKNKAHTILHEGSRRLRRIIETFTLLVKVQNEESAVDLTKNVSLSNVVDEATKDLNELIVSKNITLELTPPHSVMMVPGTSQFANQVVASILANAVDFSPLNGVIKVKLRQNGTMTSLTVSDQGQGMSDSQMSHLFSAFSRSDNSRALQIDHDGLGVSLYLDKLIMDQIGGTIEVESVVDKGTKFIITWPTPKETTFGSQILANN